MDSVADSPLFVANVARCLLSAVGVAANLLILYIIAKYPSVRTISNVYVANLAVADVSFCVFALVQGVFSIRFRHLETLRDNLLQTLCQVTNISTIVSNGDVQENNCTPYNHLDKQQLLSIERANSSYNSAYLASSISCDVGRVLAVFLACASIFLLTAIAVERYQAIVKPLDHRRRRTPRKALKTCLFMWGLAFLTATLDTVVRNMAANDWTFTYGSLFECVYLKADDSDTNQTYLALSVAIFFVLYVMPACTIIPLYARLFMTLRQPRPFAARVSPSRTLHMIFVVTVFFLVCWLPFHVTSFTVPSLAEDSSHAPFYAATALAILNSVINPFLYAFIGKKFQKHIRKVFCTSPCHKESRAARQRTRDVRTSVDSIYSRHDSVIDIGIAVRRLEDVHVTGAVASVVSWHALGNHRETREH